MIRNQYRDWRAKYRKVFGCKVVGACWCEVCVGLSTAWEEAMQAAKMSIDAARHPVNVRRDVAAKAEKGD